MVDKPKSLASHEKAEYTDYGTEAKHCSECSMYREPAKGKRPHCTAVKSPIRWHGYCKYWDAKKK